MAVRELPISEAREGLRGVHHLQEHHISTKIHRQDNRVKGKAGQIKQQQLLAPRTPLTGGEERGRNGCSAGEENIRRSKKE